MTTLTDLPNLSTITGTTATTATTSSAASTATSNTAATTDASSSTAAASFISSTSTSTNSAFHLTGLPTIEGAGIPTLVIPYTAGAPFMQKSSLPEGTVFIAVGAVLAFLGACVLLWRGLIAWSINRSVRRAALASIRGGGSEKPGSTWGGSTGFRSGKSGSGYKEIDGGGINLYALTSSGKPAKPRLHLDPYHRDTTPPPGLFFSPTAQGLAPGSTTTPSRTTSYLPAGYYASPAAAPAGGAGSTTIGGSVAPYARHASNVVPSPTASLRGVSRDGYGPSQNNYLVDPGLQQQRTGRSSALYAQPSSSSLMVGVGGGASRDSLGMPGSRAPSAYLDDLFENHGNGPRERY